ncbi:voltage-dependent calcium channel subunit alpha-2/delta-3 isoform X3 [Lates japonicus]|uniref:Voltage-dependent calcium channel subunit alpha-2/delta-3 isoform X3 n=1 Tax=Lates japonicus TaxID=270547 RepID=A0AAD3RL72_LATJO|nr:voltage-dependent calcium channel subunit alpha-2/delta-3 isoform X3 [Lates japonicus]
MLVRAHLYITAGNSSAIAHTCYFTQISTLADVQENVMEYLHVLSRPKVIDREHDTVWTEAYIDSTRVQFIRHSRIAGGSGGRLFDQKKKPRINGQPLRFGWE